MARVTKDILYPGRWLTVKGWKTYTPERVKAFHDRMQEMLAAGVNIPVCWGHQEDAVPLSAEEALEKRIKGTCGRVAESRLEGGILVADLEIDDPEDAKKLPSIRFVSPAHRPNVIGANRQWPGESIIHVALTPKPVQHTQKPFGTVKLSSETVCLSLDGYRPEYLGVDDMADEKPKKGEGDGKGDEEQAGLEGGAKLKAVLAVLATKVTPPMILPEDTTPENFLDRLHTAALTAAGKIEPKQPEEELNPAPVGLSVEDRLTRQETRLLNGERRLLKNRVKQLLLTGRITPAIRKKLDTSLDTVQLSLDEQGGLADSPAVARIEAYEELAAGAADPAGAERLSTDGDEVEMDPKHRGGPVTAQEVDQAVNDFQTMLPGHQAKK